MKLHELLERKRDLARDMLNGSADLSADDFEDVVAISDDRFDDVVTTAMLEQMRGSELEALTAALWAKRGYAVKLTKRASDHGVDVLAFKDDVLELIQCKGSGSHAQLGWDGIKDVVAGEAYYRYQYSYTELRKICVTNQTFNAYARESARANEVTLLEQHDIAAMLAESPLFVRELKWPTH